MIDQRLSVGHAGKVVVCFAHRILDLVIGAAGGALADERNAILLRRPRVVLVMRVRDERDRFVETLVGPRPAAGKSRPGLMLSHRPRVPAKVDEPDFSNTQRGDTMRRIFEMGVR